MKAEFPDDYKTDAGFDAAEDHIGPFYYRKTDAGFECAFKPASKNCNVNELVHGGVLMTFADFALCIAATEHYDSESCATISFNCEFMAAVESGNLVLCTPRVVRKTGSMVFVTGELMTDDKTAMTFSSVVKRLDNR